MIKIIKNKISQNLLIAVEWKSNRKIIVFESEDWGSIRMPNIAAVKTLRDNGFKIDKSAYMQNYSLESNDDLDNLLAF